MSLRKTAADSASQYLESGYSESLAEQALTTEAAERGQGRDDTGIMARTQDHAAWSVRMAKAAMAEDPAQLASLAREMRAARVPIDTIVDVTIPDAARELGRCWAEDRIGFSFTSIGTARLQSLLRDLMRTGTAPILSGLSDAQPALLIVVPEGEQHTLGALIASAQFSRMRYDTVLSLCESVARLRMRLRAERFAAVCLSISRVETLESAGELTEIVRKACDYPVKIMVGGAAIEAAEHSGIGADAVTNDLPGALRLCGLRISTPVEGRGETRV
jgi:MerR family transcriptional regulator, light-induced transcriptional regulator